MSNQLENITTQYEKFRKNQRISHESFNQFLAYFDTQDRLSRALLRGVGVACGFKITPLYGRVINTSKIVGVKINQGAGVTTDGTLLTLHNIIKKPQGALRSTLKDIAIESKVYTHFKVYDNAKSKYGHFYNGATQIKLWELVTEAEKTSDHTPIEQLKGVDQLNVLLYVEQYEKELKPCIGIDCDSHGLEVITNLKVVLTDDAGLTEILKKDSLFTTYDTAKLVRELPLLKLKRPILDASTKTWKLIRDKYEQIIKEKNSENKDVLDRLLEASNKIFGYFNETNQFTKAKVEYWYPKFLEESNMYAGFQHIYNYINDLLDTYEELRSLLVDIQTVCSPDIKSFPKHLMLGKVKPNEIDTKHQFYHNEVLDHEAKVERVKLLLKRFNEQVTQFNIPYYIPPATSRSTWKSAIPTGVRISPSLQYAELGDKAIPMYYKKSDNLAYAWNFEATRSRTKNQPMGYYYNHGDPSSRVISLLTGIVYNHDDKDFYRIEGQLHQGQRFTTVLSGIKNNIKQFNLDFDVIGVSLTDLKDNKDKDRASYSDYIKKHPGITHMSGVPAGGTLVLIYESESNEQIIGDFALPYRCCSEKENTSVSLETSTLCNNSQPIPLNFEPVGATVEAFVKDTKIEPFKTIGTQLHFDPSLVTGTNLNEEITFKVNGKLVDAKLTVKPLTEITVTPLLGSSNVVIDRDNGLAYVNFKVEAKTGSSLNDISSYAWDFGDGEESYQIPVDGIVIHGYRLKELQSKSFVPSVTIKTKGGCSVKYTLSGISINNLLLTFSCNTAIDRVNVKKNIPFSFLINYSDVTGFAGLRYFVYKREASGAKHTINIDWNGTNSVATNSFGNSTAFKYLSFNKNAKENLAIVTLTSSLDIDWTLRTYCPIATLAKSTTRRLHQSSDGGCNSINLGLTETVYVKPKVARAEARPLTNGDILYNNEFMETTMGREDKVLFTAPAEGSIPKQVFSVDANGVVTLVECGTTNAIIKTAYGISTECTGLQGTGNLYKIEKGTANEVVRYRAKITGNTSMITTGAQLRVSDGITSKSYAIDSKDKEIIGTFTLDANGLRDFKISVCLANCPTTVTEDFIQSARLDFTLIDSTSTVATERTRYFISAATCKK